MNVTYAVTEEAHIFENERRISYGIVAYSEEKSDGTSPIIVSIHDISPDKAKLSALVDDCNRLKLSVIHIHDVVEDFLLG